MLTTATVAIICRLFVKKGLVISLHQAAIRKMLEGLTIYAEVLAIIVKFYLHHCDASNRMAR